MTHLRWLLVLSLALVTSLIGGRSDARSLSVVELLTRYAAGHFDAVVLELSGGIDFDELLKQLRRDGLAWIDEAGLEGRARRVTAAATFALEAARAGEWHEWKLIQRQPEMCAGSECHQPLNVLYWKAPPLLIEWGCELQRQHAPI